MDLRPRYIAHPRPLTALFAELASYAAAQSVAFVGTPGTVLQRQNAKGFQFYARQYYDALGKQREQYVAGPVGTAGADLTAAALRAEIEQAQAQIPDLQLLGREGFAVVDARTWATAASLHNFGLFRAGAVLLGSHAFGVLLNQLGVRAPAYTTEDIDIGRNGPLAFDAPPTQSLLDMLNASGIAFTALPELDHRQPATSFGEIGRARFHVDLLAPSPTTTVSFAPVPELQAHATTLPWLRFLLNETSLAPILARQGCCMVRVPLPERFALHKLMASQVRADRYGKSAKDVEQAAVVLAVLAEHYPGAIEVALARVPRSGLKALRGGIAQVTPLLAAHPRALAALQLRYAV